MPSDFAVAAGAGSLRGSVREDVVFPHAWSEEGVAVELEFTGAHLLHLAAAACVLNDLYREARRMGMTLLGARVSARGEFDQSVWRSKGIVYQVQVDAEASELEVDELVRHVDEVAEIPRALRQATVVHRADA